MSSLQIRVCGRFRVQQKIYQGKNSSVYIGKNVQSDTDCALKCESKTVKPSFVLNQGKILQNLQGGIGIPHLIWYGQNGDFRFLVSELLGNSLEEYLDICGGRFSLKTTLMIAQKILSSIEFIHYKNYVHRDIKPANFLMGLGKKLHQIYTVDLAYGTTYLDPRTREHRKNEQNSKNFVGTLKFASLNVHRGNRNSRRDDLESVCLMLIYFMKGELPWSSVLGETLQQKRLNILQKYESTKLNDLCEGLPKQFEEYMLYVRELGYDDIPDYNYLRRMFKQRFIKQGYQLDYIYDWILIPLRLKQNDLSNRVPLNRFTKKEDLSLGMFGYDYDFTEDFQVNGAKIEERPKEPKEEIIQNRTKRAMSNVEAKRPQVEAKASLNVPGKVKGKGNKEDCVIW